MKQNLFQKYAPVIRTAAMVLFALYLFSPFRPGLSVAGALILAAYYALDLILIAASRKVADEKFAAAIDIICLICAIAFLIHGGPLLS